MAIDVTILHSRIAQLEQECARLQLENISLKSQLKPKPLTATSITKPLLRETAITTQQKIALFRSKFKGRMDVYPIRWENKKGKSGYSPACANEWHPKICQKPKIKCSDCSHQAFLPVTDQVIYDHLTGRSTIGVYPLLNDDTCYFVAIDFDEAEWREDTLGFMRSCKELNVPAALERSRSGKGAHIWIFSQEAIPANLARKLGSALISHTCIRNRQLKLNSYDRLFPSQDTLPKGGFGNLIALPLQKAPREHGHSVFVDENFEPYLDQWTFLDHTRNMTLSDIEAVILQTSQNGNVLDVRFVTEEDEAEPWKKRQSENCSKLPQPLPKVVKATLANQLFIDKTDLTQPLTNKLIRLAAFQNPEFYKAQAMRLSVWDKPRVIGCAENYPKHIGLPRGYLHAVKALFDENDIHLELSDERNVGHTLEVKFLGQLYEEQRKAVKALLFYDFGILSAPTAFGKTVVAAAMIAKRSTNTLILVHRTELAQQWQERLQAFLDLPDAYVGVIGGGKNKPSNNIDIAVMQSLNHRGTVNPLVENYGQVIIDECHHVSAYSFEKLLKQVKAKYILGLTATPIRRDGHHPIISMQCGPIRFAASGKTFPFNREVYMRTLPTNFPDIEEIQKVFQALIRNTSRNTEMLADIKTSYEQNRHIMVITERTEHVMTLANDLQNHTPNLFVLHGRMSQKLRQQALQKLKELSDGEPRVIVSTGKLIGEGFDHARLDTLVLAMPISWKGTLQQYVGRLQREHADKALIRIFDYLDMNHPALARMWNKRKQGYRVMGYQIVEG